MSRFNRLVLGILIFVVLAALASVWLFRARFDALARDAILEAAEASFGVGASLEKATFDPFEGRLRIEDMRIGNPPGFGAGDALSIRSAELHVDAESLGKPRIVLWRMDLSGVHMRLEESSGGDINLQALLARARSVRNDPSIGSGRRFSVTEYNVIGMTTDVLSERGGAQAIGVPDLRLTALGHDSGGLNAPEAAYALLRPLVAAALEEAVAAELLEEEPLDRQTLRDLKDLIDAINAPPGSGDSEP